MADVDGLREALAGRRDEVVIDDQCPLTFRRCDRPCGVECIRGMFVERPAAPVPPAEPVDGLREALAAHIPVGVRLGSGDPLVLADALLAGPLAPLLAKLQAVEALADQLDAETASRRRIAGATPCCGAADSIRRALSGER